MRVTEDNRHESQKSDQQAAAFKYAHLDYRNLTCDRQRMLEHEPSLNKAVSPHWKKGLAIVFEQSTKDRLGVKRVRGEVDVGGQRR